MALPWLVAIGAEYVVFRRFFAADLDAGAEAPPAAEPPEVPVFALVGGGLHAGRVSSLTSAVGVTRPGRRWRAPWCWPSARWPSAVPPPSPSSGPRTSRSSPSCWRWGSWSRAVVDNGLGGALGHLLPGGTTLPALLGIAALAAVLANLINNLPAVLVLLPLAAAAGPGAVLAVLLGVNIGPNLTYAGSLATLLWRRIVHEHDADVDLGEFTRLGLLTVPAALILAVLALWASLHVIGG